MGRLPPFGSAAREGLGGAYDIEGPSQAEGVEGGDHVIQMDIDRVVVGERNGAGFAFPDGILRPAGESREEQEHGAPLFHIDKCTAKNRYCDTNSFT
jgi:hypothetical protein